MSNQELKTCPLCRNCGGSRSYYSAEHDDYLCWCCHRSISRLAVKEPGACGLGCAKEIEEVKE